MEKEVEGVEARRPAEEAERKVGEGHDLRPWEQHSAVISLPRFDYRTTAMLLERSYSGFLITCPIKREKSATKEAISILEQKRKICSKENGGEHASCMHKNDLNNVKDSHDLIRKETSISHLDADEMMAKRPDFSLVKLTKSGLILFTFTPDRCISAVDILSRTFHSLESGDMKSPLWCHRIFPIQETCVLKENNLIVAVSKLIRQYLSNEQNELKRPVKFAVGYNRRGLDQMEIKGQKSTAEVSKQTALLDRDQCFKIVAKAVKDAMEDSVVDLISPDVIVLVELLPISGVAPGSAVAGVSILPQNLVCTKPRLTVRALISDSKAMKKSM